LLPALILALLSSACTGTLTTSETSPSPSPSVTSADGGLDLSGLPVPRTSFCGVLDEAGVTEALGSPVTGTDHYGNGDEVEVRPGYVDVSHEFGCTFEGGEGAAAKVWVFARPVGRAEARTLVRRARRGRDCAFPDSFRFGRPSLTSVCEVPGAKDGNEPMVRARLEGLFGDTWVGCEVSEPLAADEGSPNPDGTRADVVQRAERWCTEVVTTVGAQP
jgi:hypothetical protein